MNERDGFQRPCRPQRMAKIALRREDPGTMCEKLVIGIAFNPIVGNAANLLI